MVTNIRRYSADDHLKWIRSKPAAFWAKIEQRRSLEIFRKAARYVPAYKKFLKKHRIQLRSIRSLKDFDQLPATDKRNYLRQYPLHELCWNGHLSKPLVFTATSGSTGDPFYFPREEELDWQASIIHELFFLNNKKSVDGPTLILVCFGMGVWIGGLITYQAFEMTREKGYPFSILTPGINKTEVFKALRQIAPQFKQLILVGYAPFIKDIIDEAPGHHIDIKKLNPRLIFAAEAFTEKFRDHLAKKAGVGSPLINTMNIYGSADIGAMAFESPIAILLRRLAFQNPALGTELFGKINRTPTLAQYNPFFISFEAVNGELFLTGNNAIPLIKYRIGDHGGVFTFLQAKRLCQKHGIDLLAEARKSGIGSLVYQLPFVYVYERSDLSTTIYGLQIYPETIREILIDVPFQDRLTGKLTLMTKFNRSQDQYLEINVELKKGKQLSPALKKALLNAITNNLLKKNSEFQELHKFLGRRAAPKIVTWPYSHPLHFKPGIKQKWVKK